MPFHELPPEVLDILAKYAASPRLIAHLTVVYDVALRFLKQVDASWPMLEYEQQRVLFGAATHDVGKTRYPNELTGPGTQHEEIGPQLLLESGVPETYARFARTHAQWSQETPVHMEDVFVAFADTIWKGKRDDVLEREIASQIARQCRQERWEVYMKLDDIAAQLANDAHNRILWQGKHPL